MVVSADAANVTFTGTKKQQALAARIFELLRWQGQFLASDATIRVVLASVVDGLGKQGEVATATEVNAALSANTAVFGVEGAGDDVVVLTTRDGRVPVEAVLDTSHSFVHRFMTPLPKPTTPLVRRERTSTDRVWEGLAGLSEEFEAPRPSFGRAEIVPRQDERIVTQAERDAAAAAIEAESDAEDVIIDDIEAGDASGTVDEFTTGADGVDVPAEAVIITVPTPVLQTDSIEVENAAVAAAGSTDQTIDLDSDDLVEVAADEAEDGVVAVTPHEPETPAAVAAPPVAPVAPAPAPRPAPPAMAARAGLANADLADLTAAIGEQLAGDNRIAVFGDQIWSEDRVPRFSRGDLRRIKDYIEEQEQPLTDTALVQDILNVRPQTPDFEAMRFALNFRLSREHRDYDFVGTRDQRFWSISNLAQIGTTRRKPNEIGTDYRFLLDEVPAGTTFRTQQSIDHVVSFYEYIHGLLPMDANLQSILPAPIMADQRSAVLTFETPQSFTTYLVELRYPSPNRGGFILGLDDFYAENVVPGAILSITATENDGHYRVEYISQANQNERLLELDERRTARYVFRPTAFHCGVEDDYVLSEERFPRLASEKPLDDKARRRPENVIAATFERIGDQQDGLGYSASFSRLFTAVNIERPMSERLLRQTLESDESGAFAKDPEGDDVYTYVPSRPAG
ncbi:MAG: hypothetical protein WKF80_02775 [Thermomicrobiales bacterium]